MATNKHAIIRYHALDKCFSNTGRKFFIEDLITACNEAIYEFTGTLTGVKRRQIFNDIQFMESDQGYAIELDRIKDGRRIYYRYSKKNFSIQNNPINPNEAERIQETLLMLSRFSGAKNFEWIDEMRLRLKSEFSIPSDQKLMYFDENPYLKGAEHIDRLFNHLSNKQVIRVQYSPYKYDSAIEVEIHPYFLKQYNGRWFLIGWNEENQYLMNLALDRILSFDIQEQTQFIEKHVDPNDLFEDIIGVTIPRDEKCIEIQIRVDKDLWPYVRSKPIHGSQKKIEETENYTIIQIEVIPNYELYATLLSFGPKVVVLSPGRIKNKLKTLLEDSVSNYDE